MTARALAAFASGFVFALGLGVAHMTDPTKVRAFLDFFGAWDPSLLFVMGGAVAVYAVAFRALMKRARPALAERYDLPALRRVTPRLVGGAALFGVGWGLSGLCPGPALVGLATGAVPLLVFVGAMAAGIVAFQALSRV